MLFRKIDERDIPEIQQLFKACITDLVTREKKEQGLIEQEIENLNQVVQQALADARPTFFVTEANGRIVGSIAIKQPNSFINENVSTIPGVYEVACVYVHPYNQREGIGTFMFQQIKEELTKRGQTQFYLDAGFVSSQQYWEKQLGSPTFVLKNYWGKGEHHLIWLKNVDD